jgi:haloacetate dehalogenase
MPDFFPGFEQRQIETTGATINLVTGGGGPALLLLHGYPQTHVMWRKVAPRLAQDFTVVVPDLRGYGDSSKPPAGENFVNYSKRALALDQVEVMAALGHDRFAVAGHDRGGLRTGCSATIPRKLRAARRSTSSRLSTALRRSTRRRRPAAGTGSF